MAAAVAQANIRHLLLIENNLKSEEGATKHNRTTHVYLPFPPHSWGRFPSCPLLPLPLAQKQSWNSRVWRFRLFFRILLQSKVCSRCICFARWEHTSRCLSYNCLSLCSSGRQITAFRPKMCDCCFIILIASLVFVSLLSFSKVLFFCFNVWRLGRMLQRKRLCVLSVAGGLRQPSWGFLSYCDPFCFLFSSRPVKCSGRIY